MYNSRAASPRRNSCAPDAVACGIYGLLYILPAGDFSCNRGVSCFWLDGLGLVAALLWTMMEFLEDWPGFRDPVVLGK